MLGVAPGVWESDNGGFNSISITQEIGQSSIIERDVMNVYNILEGQMQVPSKGTKLYSGLPNLYWEVITPTK